MARITEQQKRAIADDLRSRWGAVGTRVIAEAHGVSQTTVRRVATAAGIGAVESARAQTKSATVVTTLSLADRRARLSERFVEMAERAMDDMVSPATIYNFGGKDNTYNERQVPRPPTADQRNLAIIAATAVDKHGVLERFDTAGRAAAQIDAFLGHLTGEA